MRRAHLGYDKLLKAVREDVEAMVPIKERREHWDAMKVLTQKLQAIAKPLPLGTGPNQAIIADALAQAESYIELKKADENTSYPTTPRLKVEQSDHDAAIDEIANSQSILEENKPNDYCEGAYEGHSHHQFLRVDHFFFLDLRFLVTFLPVFLV